MHLFKNKELRRLIVINLTTHVFQKKNDNKIFFLFFLQKIKFLF